jgi:hypothetical protein
VSALDSLLPADLDPALRSRGWEFGRLVLDSRFRSGPDLVGRSIYLGMRELANRTGAENVFASCSPAHARLYRRFGFDQLPGACVGRSSGAFCLVHGEMGQVLRVAGGAPQRPALSLVN